LGIGGWPEAGSWKVEAGSYQLPVASCPLPVTGCPLRTRRSREARHVENMKSGLALMSVTRELRTDRLHLRCWRPGDRSPFAAMNADPRVMEFFPGLLSREESDRLVARIAHHFEQHGFGLWALEIRGIAPFAGFIGLSVPRFVAHFTPCVEIGWRVAAEHWGHGYATEGARAVLRFGFDTLDLPEIVSFTVTGNHRSRRVMERIGMVRDPADDFDHPSLPDGHPLRRHVLYRINRAPHRGRFFPGSSDSADRAHV